MFSLSLEVDIADDAFHDFIGRATHYLSLIENYLVATGQQSQQALI